MKAAVGALCALILIAAADVRAQTCGLAERVPFAGHNLPLDSVPDPQPMTLAQAFPITFSDSVFLTAPTDGTNRLFVVQQPGRIRVFENRDDVSSSILFLDIATEVDDSKSELGLLGLAFDPDYATNRRFYVNYTSSTDCQNPGVEPWCTKLVRFETMVDDPNAADPESGVLLLRFPQPASNHNGGMLAFGPDGMLYMATGDGGSGRSEAQSLASLYGAILRLDVREGAPSLIPADNPFVDTPGAAGEIYHYGLRNPWRFSFDRLTGDLWIGDVGQSNWEEIDFAAAGVAGLNFGWPQCEGTHDFDGPCDEIDSVAPVIEFDHGAAGGKSVIGGYVYRGDRLPELYGSYIYTDFVSHIFWAYDPVAAGTPEVIATATRFMTSFGEDRDGEIYVMSSGGRISEFEAAGGANVGAFPQLLSETGLFADTPNAIAAPGLIEYEVTTPLSSDGALKRRWMALPGSQKIAFHASQAWSFPVGTVFVKQFELPLDAGGTTRLETRVLLQQNTRWLGVTYVWNEAQDDAVLVTDGADDTIDLGVSMQDWHYPSSSECYGCHTSAAGRVLGVRSRQLGGDFPYPDATDNQLHALNCIELFDSDIREPTRYPGYAPVDDGAASALLRSRSYLESNCSMCHQPLGPAPVDIDLRFDSALIDMGLIDEVPTEGDLGLFEARRIKVGVSSESVLYDRMASTDPMIRMAPGTLIPDADAVAVMGGWIDTDLTFLDSDQDTVADDTDVCPTVPDPGQEDTDMDGLGDACDPDALPDLQLSSLTAPTQTTGAAPLPLAAEVTNTGSGVDDFAVTFYLSEDANLDPGLDRAVGHCWIEGLAVAAVAECAPEGAMVPSELMGAEPPEAFYWISCADRMDSRLEADDENNCTASTEPVLVPEPAFVLMQCFALAALMAVRRHRGRTPT